MPYRGRYNFDMGHTYGEISVHDNDVGVALSLAAIVQVTDFDTTGEYYKTTPCGDGDHIEILSDGIYLVQYFASIVNEAAQSHVLSMAAYTNNGSIELATTHSHHNLTGGSGDVIHAGGSSMVLLERGETVELWATTDSSDSRSVVFEDVTMHVLRLGGI